MNNIFDPVRQNKLAEQFHALHHADDTLVLMNAWDCVSAKINEEAGFPAIATTSSGISWSCGYKDGEHIPPELMIEVVGRIANAVNIPVTADFEGGYAKGNTDKFSKFIHNIIEAGAVGINLEDGDSQTGKLNEIAHQMEEIRMVKAIAKQKGVNLFVNARTDAMMLAPGDLKARINVCIERAKAFEEAGADGIFIPFVKEMETVSILKEAIHLPLNILIEDSLDIATLRKLKVNRISTGSKPILTTISLLKSIASELSASDNWGMLFTEETTYAEMNKLF